MSNTQDNDCDTNCGDEPGQDEGDHCLNRRVELERDSRRHELGHCRRRAASSTTVFIHVQDVFLLLKIGKLDRW